MVLHGDASLCRCDPHSSDPVAVDTLSKVSLPLSPSSLAQSSAARNAVIPDFGWRAFTVCSGGLSRSRRLTRIKSHQVAVDQSEGLEVAEIAGGGAEEARCGGGGDG